MLNAKKGVVLALPMDFDTTAATPDSAINLRDPKVSLSEKGFAGAAVLACDETAAVSIVVASVEAPLTGVSKSFFTAVTE